MVRHTPHRPGFSCIADLSRHRRVIGEAANEPHAQMGTRGRRMLGWSLVAAALFAARLGGAQELGTAPFLPESERVTVPFRLAAEGDVPPIDTGSRTEVVAAFHASYLPSEGVATGWNGNASTCVLGVNSAAHEQATLRRVNYFRAMAGLPGVVGLDEIRSDKCVKAAMMMSAQGQLSHAPGISWACYSADGAEAAGKSNIALGAEGPSAVDLYMDDHGPGNHFVGHRRWILYPPQQVMGTGSVPTHSGKAAANALWVLANFGPRPSGPEFIAWPPPGYFPHQLLPKLSTRWSFSLPNADFGPATVSVSRNGQALTTAVQSRSDAGFGDNTFVWTVAGVPSLAPAADTDYVVSITHVSVGGQTRSFTYTVTVIDPFQPNLDLRQTGGQLTLAWPTGPAGFLVQTGAFNGTSISWGTAGYSPTASGSERRVTLTPSEAIQLFRLRRP
ncbi:MAG TPA: hypothetical protein DCY13_12540 [Verrucomicrobiales bacterium]|nr:hypothetical protein [Verrucomicrobiales bacterium]